MKLHEQNRLNIVCVRNSVNDPVSKCIVTHPICMDIVMLSINNSPHPTINIPNFRDDFKNIVDQKVKDFNM